MQNATYGIVKAGRFQRAGVPMLRGGDIRDGTIFSGQPLISHAKSEEYSRTILRERDVVIALVGYPGETAVIPRRLVGANISRAVGLLRPARTLLPEFLVHYLNSPAGRREFLRPSAGSAQIVVNLKALNDLRLPLPSLRDQRAISAALDDVGVSLRGLECLIVKKRDLKQAAMQQLLSGRTRLHGFAGEWSLSPLGQVAHIKTGPFGSSLHERDYVDVGTPIITVEHLGEYGIEHSGLPLVSEADRRRLSAYSLAEGDIVFSRVGSVDRNALVRASESGWRSLEGCSV